MHDEPHLPVPLPPGLLHGLPRRPLGLRGHDLPQYGLGRSLSLRAQPVHPALAGALLVHGVGGACAEVLGEELGQEVLRGGGNAVLKNLRYRYLLYTRLML